VTRPILPAGVTGLASGHAVAASVLLVAYAFWSFAGRSLLDARLDAFTRNLVEQALLSAFFVVHALAALRPRAVLAYAAICFVVSNLFENASVLTGFPFGAFHHSEATGPRLFEIPWLATPTYMAMGWVSWVVAQVLADRLSLREWRYGRIGATAIAAVVFTMWDLCNDAVFHTMNRAFFYDHPGPWFGVPLSNFAGWLLTTATVYGLFGHWLATRPAGEPERAEPPLSWWYQALAMYVLVAAAGIWRNVRGGGGEVILSNGDTWRGADLYASMTLVTLFTMGFVSLLAWLRLSRHPYER